MVTIKELIYSSSKKMGELSATPLLDVQVILCRILDVDRMYLLVHGNDILEEGVLKEFEDAFEKRMQGMPVQYIVKHQEFMGLDFFVDEGVLIPRPDTEILIEEILKLSEDREKLNILDIGTGSGAITVSLAKFLKGSKVYSMDISSKAIEIASKNAVNNGVSGRIEFINQDMLEFLDRPFLNNEIDILVSNPPYIPSNVINDLQIEVKKYEPRIALDGGNDGFDFYRAIINNAHKILTKNGILAFEVGHDQAEVIKELMNGAEYKNIKIIKDLAMIDRVVIGELNR